MTLILLEKSNLLAMVNKWWPEILSYAIDDRNFFPKKIDLSIPKPIDIKHKHTLIQNNQLKLQYYYQY